MIHPENRTHFASYMGDHRDDWAYWEKRMEKFLNSSASLEDLPKSVLIENSDNNNNRPIHNPPKPQTANK